MTDSHGDKSTVVKDVELTTGLVVNSTGDASADDPEDGCDTGATIGNAPECTLRAAIEVANDGGGGVIAFDIAGGGVPSIAATSPLPTIIGPTTIDGTTQAGGWVEVVGTGAQVLQLQGGPSLVTGLVVRGGALQIHVTGGTGQLVRGNRIGTNAAGTAGDAGSSNGIMVSGGDGARIEDNVIGTADIGIGLRSGSTTTTVDGNRIGVSDDGAAAMGDTEVGVIVNAPNATISDNTIRGTSVGIELLRATATDAKVTDNAVGTRHDGTAAFDGQAYGIRSDGAPGATITGNRVAATNAIVLAGSDQSTTQSDGIHLEPVSTEPIDGAATGAKATVADNDIGLLASGTNAGTTTHGIAIWAGMADTTIDGNRIGATQATAIKLLGGSRHTLTRNSIGGDTDEGTPTPVHDGILVNGSTDVTIGGVGGAGNSIVHTDDGIDATDTASGLRIEANRIAAANAEAEGAGIEVGDGAPGAVITSNRIVGGSAGIASEAPSAKFTGNQLLAQSDVGIEAAGDGVNVSGNVVTAGSDGVRVGGTGSTVTQNRIGLENGSDTVIGNGGTGLTIEGGKVVVSKNVIAGTGAEGIKVNAGAKATLRSNRVWETNGEAIDVADGPEAPDLAAAVRSGSGEDTRTTLLMKDLPEGDAGTIEVFANRNCASSEAQFLMDINRTKTATETARIIQIKGASTRDHFTVTYTDRDGNTSELSSCVDAGTYPDGDGDGSIDVFDEFVHAAGNPSAGVYATDNEKLMLALVSPYDERTGRGGGEIDRLEFVNDPDSGSHPAGWTAPYGIMSFRIRNLQPGARTNIAFAIIDPSDPFPANTGYWKYGPETSGAAPTWWDFAFDDASGTGVRVTDGVDLPSIGITRVLSLALADGGRGDSDGGANGTITDPGGPVLGARTEPPTTTTTTTTTTTPVTPTSGAGPVGAMAASSPPAATSPTVASSPAAASSPTSATKAGSLPITGADPWALITAGLCALALGLVLITTARRRSAVPKGPR